MEYDYSRIEIKWGDGMTLYGYLHVHAYSPHCSFELFKNGERIASVIMRFKGATHPRQELVKMAKGERSECGSFRDYDVHSAIYNDSDERQQIYYSSLWIGKKAMDQLKAEILKRFEKPKKVVYVDADADEVRIGGDVLWSRGCHD